MEASQCQWLVVQPGEREVYERLLAKYFPGNEDMLVDELVATLPARKVAAKPNERAAR